MATRRTAHSTESDISAHVFVTLEKLGEATELELLQAIEPFPDGFDADALRAVLAAAPAGVTRRRVRQRNGTEVTRWSAPLAPKAPSAPESPASSEAPA